MKAITIHLPDELEPAVHRAIIRAVHLAAKAMTHGLQKGHRNSFEAEGHRVQLRHALGHLVLASAPWQWLRIDRSSGHHHLFNAGARIIFALATYEPPSGPNLKLVRPQAPMEAA